MALRWRCWRTSSELACVTHVQEGPFLCRIVCVHACTHLLFGNTSHPQKLPEAEIRAREELQSGASVVHVSSLAVGVADSPSA